MQIDVQPSEKNVLFFRIKTRKNIPVEQQLKTVLASHHYISSNIHRITDNQY